MQTGCPNIGLNSFGYESHCAASTGYYLVGCTKLQSSAHAEYEREHLAEKAAGAIDLKKCKITAHIASCASIMSHSLPSFFGQFLLDLLPRLIGAAALLYVFINETSILSLLLDRTKTWEHGSLAYLICLYVGYVQ